MAEVAERLARFFGKRGNEILKANLAVIAAAYDEVIDVTGASLPAPIELMEVAR
jgi:hypothetical protein